MPSPLASVVIEGETGGIDVEREDEAGDGFAVGVEVDGDDGALADDGRDAVGDVEQGLAARCQDAAVAPGRRG